LHTRLLGGPPLYVLNRSGIPLVPFELARRFAIPWGDFAYAVWHSKRQKALRNYARILGLDITNPAVERAARRCFRHFARYIAEIIHVQGWDNNTVLDRLEVRGEEHFDDAESHGKGIIFASAHMGSAEVAAAIAIMRGYKITAVTERFGPPAIMDWAQACRARMGVTLVPAHGAGIRLLRSLRRREMIAFVLDIALDRSDGVPISFFGKPTVFPAGPARLARLSGAPLIFAVAARRPGGRFIAHIEPPLVSNKELSAEEDIARLTRRLAAAFESYVRRYPEQWYVFRDIWAP